MSNENEGKVTIELLDTAAYFFLPGGKLHLSTETPGPVEVNPEIFSPVEKRWITNAHNKGTIKVVKTGKYAVEAVEKKELEAKIEETPTKAADTTNQPPGKELPTDLPSLLNKGKKLLTTGVKTIEAALEGETNLLYLKTLRDLESQKIPKARKSVIKLLSGKIQVLEEQVVESLGGQDIGDTLTPYGVRIDESQLEIADDVEERTIEIRPAREEDYSDPVEDTSGS